MSNPHRLVMIAAALTFSCAIHAAENTEDIKISGAWARATAPGQEQAAVDLTITSKHSATLVGASSPASKSAALHSMTTENGMMMMREVKSIDLPAGKPMNLGHGGYHLMLDGLKAPLKEGETLPLTLRFKLDKQGLMKIETTAEVKSLTTTDSTSPDEGHQSMPMH